MISANGKQFLERVISSQNIEEVIKYIAYSERITIALDLQIIVKQLIKEIQDKTGEDMFCGMLERPN